MLRRRRRARLGLYAQARARAGHLRLPRSHRTLCTKVPDRLHPEAGARVPWPLACGRIAALAKWRIHPAVAENRAEDAATLSGSIEEEGEDCKGGKVEKDDRVESILRYRCDRRQLPVRVANPSSSRTRCRCSCYSGAGLRWHRRGGVALLSACSSTTWRRRPQDAARGPPPRPRKE